VTLHNPDSPDPSDRTIQRLEAVEAFDEWFPRWRSIVGESQRNGWALGWLDPATPLAGGLLAEPADADGQQEVEPLPMQPEQIYYLLRPPEAQHAG
jgi:hypothetical protein